MNRKAFTLLELVLVMGIIVLIAGMVAPSLSGFAAGRRVNYAATQLVTLATYARSQSISDAQIYRLNFDTSGGTYWLTTDDGTGKFTSVPGEAGRQYSVPDGVRLDIDAAAQADGRYIAFQPDGRVDTSQITLTDWSGRSIRVICQSPTENYHVAAGEGT